MTFETLKILNEAKIHSNLEFNDLDISIEVPAGGARKGVNKKTGQAWEHKIGAHYGYIKGTHSPDGEHLDCYVRKNPKKDAKVYVVHQMTVDGSKFDEDKVMLGFTSSAEARAMFKSCTFKPATMYGGMTEFSMEHFRVVAYQASKSTAMLSDEATFSEFSKKGLLPRGIKSPLMVARRVSEGLSELSQGLNLLSENLEAGDVQSCLLAVGYDGTLPATASSLEDLINEAYDQFLIFGMKETTTINESEFRNIALNIITTEDAYMTDVTDELVSEGGERDYSSMPQINFEDSRDCDAAYNFANERMLQVSRDMNVLYFHDANDYETYMQDVQYSGDAASLMGDKTEDLKAAGYEEHPSSPETAVYNPASVFGETYTVMLSTQLLENVGSEYSPLWSHSTGRYIPVQAGIPTYGEARKIVAEVSAGLIPVELNLKESVVGIDVVTDGEFRQFYETTVADEAIEEETTDDVFFQQQIQETKTLAGMKEGQSVSFEIPSVHVLKAKLEALQESQRAAAVEESAFNMPTSLEDFPKAMRIVGKTLIKNPNHSAMSIVKAVAKSILGDVSYAEELKDFIETQTQLGIDSYAYEVRDTGITESTESSWKLINSTTDVTGDDSDSWMTEYGTTELVQKKPADSSEFARDILTYMNPARDTKLVMTPTWDGGNGSCYRLELYRKG